jgi:hypothetical protein
VAEGAGNAGVATAKALHTKSISGQASVTIGSDHFRHYPRNGSAALFVLFGRLRPFGHRRLAGRFAD